MADAGALPEVTVSGGEPAPSWVDRQTGQTVTSASGDYYLDPKLITPRLQQRGIYPGANTEEVATLVVNGLVYEDWETVWFQWTLGDPYAQFRFTATEDDTYLWVPDPDNRLPFEQLLRFKPGDECDLYLGGYPIMHGVIMVRQVAYDKNNHTIVLQGVTLTYYAANASIIDEKAEYEGTFLDIAGEVLAPTCSGYKIWGKISQLKFEDPQRPNPGETIFEFLERIARDRKVIVTSDPYGDFLFIGEHEGEYVSDLVEGGNILKCQAVIADLKAQSEFIARGQSAGSDDQNMKKAAHQEARIDGTAKCYSPLLTPIEHQVWTREEIELRAANEKMFAEGQHKVEATVTVQGWFNPRTGLRWDVGQDVHFQSPMTGIDNQMLKIRTVTYTQDKNGSLTTMVLVAPWGFNDSNFKRGLDKATQGLGRARSDDGPATTPPVQVPHSSR
jgi:prophage tail gpP-like protein